MPSPSESAKLRGYTWYTTADFHHGSLGVRCRSAASLTRPILSGAVPPASRRGGESAALRQHGRQRRSRLEEDLHALGDARQLRLAAVDVDRQPSLAQREVADAQRPVSL